MSPRRLFCWSGFVSGLLVGFATFGTAVDLAVLRTLEAGADQGTLENAVGAGLRVAEGDARVAIERQLVAVALDASATPAGRQLACRMLRLCATDQTAAALAPLLAEPLLADHARLVLEDVVSPVADLALIAGLARSEGDVRRGIIASLAARGTGAAFAPLAELVTRADEPTAIAALHALAAVARDAGDANLIAALPLGPAEPLLVAQQEAFFSALSRLADQGVEVDTVVIPFPKMEARTPAVADLAASVVLRLHPAQAVPQIIAMLQTGDPLFERRAAHAISRLHDAERRTALMARATEIPVTVLPLVIGGLTAVGGSEVLPFARQVLVDDVEGAQVEALAAIGRFGSAEDVPVLLRFAAGKAPTGAAARGALQSLPDLAADPLLIEEFTRTASPLRPVLPEVFVGRVMRSAIPALLAAAETTDRRLAGMCYDAVGRLGAGDLMPTLWERWTQSKGADRTMIERALVAIARRDATGASTRWLLARDQKKDAALHATVIRMTGAVGDEVVLEYLAALTLARKPDEAALRAVVAWRGPAALPVLEKAIAGRRLSAPLRAVAWTGLLDLTRDRMRTRRDEALPWLDVALKLARRAEDRTRVVAVAAAFPHRETLAWLETQSSDPKIAAEVKAAHAAMQAQLAAE